MKNFLPSVNRKYLFLAAYLILWIILFEFIIPVNRFIPKPSLVIMSIPSLVYSYHLVINMLSTISTVYLGIIFGWVAAWLIKSFLFHEGEVVEAFFASLTWLIKFVPAISAAVFFVLWSPNKYDWMGLIEILKYLFSFLVVFFSIILFFPRLVNEIPSAYIQAAESLDLSEKQIITIKWKTIEPGLTQFILDIHVYIWTLVLLFEFIKQGYGLGNILRNALQFKDLSALFATAIIISIIVWCGYQFIKWFKDKYFFWGEE
jgi:ABC-type nitrate/sulfonate/bicarbonate transport system permease component